MKIAIVGSGRVGTALAGGWVKAGHDICFGSRDPNGAKVAELLKQLGPHTCADSPAEAARWAEVVVLATPYHAAQSSVQALGDLGGKVLIDTTNVVSNGQLTVGFTTSGAEQIAGWARNARVVKAFNITGAATMANPQYPDGKASMLFCGDDPAARAVVKGLVADLGFDALEFGELANARLLEPLAMAWIRLAFTLGYGPNIAFRLMKR